MSRTIAPIVVGLGFAFLILTLGSASAQGARPLPKSVAEAIRQAWIKAGAQPAWLDRDPFGRESFTYDTRDRNEIFLPAFLMDKFAPGSIGKLRRRVGG